MQSSRCPVVTTTSVILCLNKPGLASVYWSKGWQRWWWQLDNWSYKSCKAPVKSPPSNQHPVFYRPDALPVAQPTVSMHWREKYHIPWTCLPQAHPGVFQLCFWPLIAHDYLGWGLPCLSSALWCQYPSYSSGRNEKIVDTTYKNCVHLRLYCTSLMKLSPTSVCFM